MTTTPTQTTAGQPAGGHHAAQTTYYRKDAEMFDLTWREIRNDLAIVGRSLVGRWQQTTALFAVAVLMSMTGLAASSSATTTSPSAAPTAVHVNSFASWQYFADTFSQAHCVHVGKTGIAWKQWITYQCIQTTPTIWQLWVLK